MTNVHTQQIETLKAKIEVEQTKVRAAEQTIREAREREAELVIVLARAQLNALIIAGGLPDETVVELLAKYGQKDNVVPIRQGSKKERVGGKKVARQTAGTVKQTPAVEKVPSLVVRIKTVMGKRATSISDILAGLAERPGWTPTSKDVKGYVSSTLSSHQDFINVSRGVYAVAGSKAAEKATEKASAAPKQPSTKKAPTKKASAKKVTQATAAPAQEPRSREAVRAAIGSQRKAVADGVLPSLKQRIMTVLREEGTLKVSEIIKSLERRGWSPQSDDQNTYLSSILSSDKKAFVRASRGHYRLADEAPAAASTSTKEPVRAKATNGQPNREAPAPESTTAEPTPEEVSNVLDNFVEGTLESNPFG